MAFKLKFYFYAKNMQYLQQQNIFQANVTSADHLSPSVFRFHSLYIYLYVFDHFPIESSTCDLAGPHG